MAQGQDMEGGVLGWHPKPIGCTPTKVAWAAV